ncbi:pilin N-terminal domain-containing protein [Lacticaseibacillus yichunensis]|uniref:Pilin N-terminal domain-containing protein n=1 Tax=Lacticaseibacillus yichunensis TaxID=2486015 RepID=A0ABW4CPU2_9LACO|nr:pilin N-terminal domain-containing protein [Lacticaseibacillus yichunensis]
MKKKWLLFLAAALMALPFLGKAATVQAAPASSDDIQVVLHKRVFREARIVDEQNPWSYENDGLAKENDPLSFGLNGANFVVYDLSDRLAEDLEAAKGTGKSQADVKAELVDEFRKLGRRQSLEYAADNNLRNVTPTGSGKTGYDSELDENGIARFDLPTYTSDGQMAAYLLLETHVDKDTLLNVDMYKRALPIVVITPFANPSDQTKLLDTIHVYSKNIGYVRDPYFFKYGKNADGTEVPLQGATFAITRYENGQKLYLSMSPVTDLRNEWITSSDPLNDSRVDKFVSDERGLVDSGQRFLPSGTFYFEELTSVSGYINDLTPTSVKIEIPEEWYDENGNFNYVTINGQNLLEAESGIVPEEAIALAMPRIYNSQASTTTAATPTTPSKPSQSGMLPSMSDAQAWLLAIIGLVVMVGSWFIIRRRIQNKAIN